MMKKRILAYLLSATLVVGLVPATAWAGDLPQQSAEDIVAEEQQGDGEGKGNPEDANKDVIAQEGNANGEDATVPEGNANGEDATVPEGNANGEDATAPEGNANGEDVTASEGNANDEDATAPEEKQDQAQMMTLTEAEPKAEAVAKIGETSYSTLAEAIKAAQEGDTVKLLDNITLAQKVTVKEKNITLDLNGKTINPDENYTSNGLVWVDNNAMLTIEDSAGNGSIDANGNQNVYAAVIIWPDGPDTPAKLVVNGGILKGFYYGISGNGTGHGTTITINDGEMIGTNGTGIYHPQGGTLTINGGEITGENTAIELRSGKLNIHGGTFTSTAKEYKEEQNGSGTTVIGAALAISQHTTKKDIQVTIDGGTFNGVYALRETKVQNQGTTENIEIVSISNGTFNGTVASDDCKNFISGGTFSNPPAAGAVAENLVRILKADGTYSVTKKVDSMVETGDSTGIYYENEAAQAADHDAKIGDTYYKTLAEAINAANRAEKPVTITLNRDVKDVAPFVLNSGVTFDGNNKTITAKKDVTDNLITMTAGNVTIKNLTINGNENKLYGVHAYNCENVQLNNVTIKDCGKAGLLVNSAKVTANGLYTSGNTWGSVNVDDNAKNAEGELVLPMFTFNSGKLEEDVQIYDEVEGDATVVNVGAQTNLKEVTGVGDKLKGFTFYTDDVSKLGAAYNETTNTIYESLKTALDEAEEGNTLSVVKDTELTENAIVADGVTLVVNPDVTLDIGKDNLTNNGTIDNKGSIVGTPKEEGKGEQITYRTVTFNVKTERVTITVKDANGDVVSANADGSYTLKSNEAYTWTATRSGYRSKSGTIAKSENDEEIEIKLSKKSSSSGGSSSSSSSDKEYSIAIDKDIDNGKVKVDPSKAEKGDKVTITVTPDKGYEINKVTVKDADGDKLELKEKGKGEYTFTMPDSKVEVKATFVKAEEKPETPAEAKTIILTIDQKIANVFGEYVVNDVAPIIRNERTMLPIRFIAQNLGAEVAWDDALNKVTITKDDLKIELYINSAVAVVNGENVTLDAPAFIENSRTYLPLRFVAENLGATVTWDAAARQVTIQK